MNCDKKELLVDLLSNELDGNERAVLENHLLACTDCRTELAELKNVWQMMCALPVEAPSSSIKMGFNAMLNDYKKEVFPAKNPLQQLIGKLKQAWQLQPDFKLAYSFLLLMIGLGAGYLFTKSPEPKQSATDEHIALLATQVQEMKQAMMVSLLENPSASERMRAVSYTNEISSANSQIIEALLSTLNNDPNVNVRLVTLEALVKFAQEPKVREGLVQSIAQQDSPLVQSAIADVMVKLQEKSSLKPLRELLEKKDLNDAVKDKIQESIHLII